MFLLTDAQFNVLRNIYDSGAPTRFADIYDQIHAWVKSPYCLGNSADGNVVAWFGAAALTNRGVSRRQIPYAPTRQQGASDIASGTRAALGRIDAKGKPN